MYHTQYTYTDPAPTPSPIHAQMLQLQTQYLLFCHQTMRERHAEVERRIAKLKSHEEAYSRKASQRKEKIRTLGADAKAQDDLIQS